MTQTFDVDLSQPAIERTITTSTAPGAAHLETSSSVDRYAFTVPENSSVVANINGNYSTSGTGGLVWKLIDADGQVVHSGELKTTLVRTFNDLSGSYYLQIERNPALSNSLLWSYNHTIKLKRTPV